MNEETWKENFCRLLQNKYFLSKHCSQSSARSPCQLGGGGGGVVRVTCLNFIRSRVGSLSMFTLL